MASLPPVGPPPGTASPALRPRWRLLELYGRLLGPLLVGYMLFDRAFAYVHLPGTPLFLAELALGLGVLGVLAATPCLTTPLRQEPVLAVLAAFLLWGLVRALPGLPVHGVDAVRDSAVWYYGLFALLAVAALARSPELLDRLVDGLVRVGPWMLLWLPVAVLLAPFAERAPTVPFSSVSVLSHKTGNAAVAALLVLAALWLFPRGRLPGRTGWSLLALLVIALAATQNRGGLLGAAVGVGVWLAFQRNRIELVAKTAVIVVVAVALAALLEVEIPVGGLQGRSYSASQLVNNVLSLSGTSSTGNLAGTVEGRQVLWNKVLERRVTDGELVEGAGFGLNLASQVGVLDEGADSLRTPHNSHLDVLARMGLIGLGLWLLLWGCWYWRLVTGCRRLARLGLHRRHRVAAVCLAVVTSVLVSTFFDPQLEGPQMAALVWTLFGIGVAVTSTRSWFRGGLPREPHRSRPAAGQRP